MKRRLVFLLLVFLVLVAGVGSAEETLTIPNQDDSEDGSGDNTGTAYGLLVEPNEERYLTSINVYDALEGTATTVEVRYASNGSLVASGTPGQDKVQFNDVVLAKDVEYAIGEIDGYSFGDSSVSYPVNSPEIDVTGRFASCSESDFESGNCGSSGSGNPYLFWEITTETTNSDPVITSNNTIPSPPVYGENVGYSVDVTDSDGTVSSVEVDVQRTNQSGGSPVQVLSDASLTNTQGSTWELDPAFNVSEKNVWYNATFTATDNEGATSTSSLDVQITDTAPNVQLHSPGNETVYTYDVPYNVTVNGGDSVVGESVSCTLYNAGSSVTSFMGTEPFTETGTFRQDLATGVSMNVTCTDPAGNTGGNQSVYTVDNYELQSSAASSPVYETENVSYDGSWKLGDMVNGLEAALFWNGTRRAAETYTGSGVRTRNVTQYFRPPLVTANRTNETWNWQYTVNYTLENGTATTDVLNSSAVNQEVWWSYWLENAYLEQSDYIEREDYRHYTRIRNVSDQAVLSSQNRYWRDGTSAASSVYNRTGDYTVFEGGQDTGNMTGYGNTTKFNVSSKTYVSFNGDTRQILSNNDTLNLYRIRITACGTGLSTANALTFNTFDETNRSDSVSSTLAMAAQVWKTGEIKRTYSFSSTGTSTHEFCIYPSWAEYTIDTTEKLIQYDADGYTKRSYFLVEEQISNQTTTVPLYLLSDSLSEVVRFEVQDANGNSAEDVVIRVNRYFPSNDKYITVAMSRTGSEGTTESYLESNEIYYQFWLYRNGTALKQVGPQTLPSDNSLLFRLGADLDLSFLSFENNVGYACAANTENVSCSYTSETEELENMTLKVEQQEVIGYSTVCTQSAATVDATLTCTGLNTSSTKYRYVLYGEFTTGTHTFTQKFLGFEDDLFGISGVLVALFLVMTAAAGGLWRPEAAVALPTLVFAVCASINLIAVGTGATITIVCLGALLTWRLSG